LRKERYICDTVTVKIRYDNFKTISRQKKLADHIERDDLIFRIAKNLFLNNFNGGKIRLLGVSASGLICKDNLSLDPIFDLDRKHQTFDNVVDSIKNRFGENSIRRGGSIRS
jgi:DNA polymerase-4